jgi:hypothetical protein
VHLRLQQLLAATVRYRQRATYIAVLNMHMRQVLHPGHPEHDARAVKTQHMAQHAAFPGWRRSEQVTNCTTAPFCANKGLAN